MPTTRYNPFLQSYPYAGYLSTEETEEEKNPFLNPPRPEPGPPPPDMESMKDLYAADLPDEGVDPNDPETRKYIERSKEALPSQGMYSEYARRKPDYKSEGMKPKWWELLLGGLAQLSPSEAHKRAGAMLPHKRYQEALRDWETEGKYLSPQAKAADEARKRELEAERFGIVGQAKRKQFEAGEKKRVSAEEAGKRKEEAAAAKEERLGKEASTREARAEASSRRSEAAAARAEERLNLQEKGFESREKAGETKARKGTFAGQEADLEDQLADEETNIKKDIQSEFPQHFAANKQGKLLPKPESEKRIRELVKKRFEARKKELEDRFQRTAERGGLIQPLDEPDIPSIESAPIPKRPEETSSWYQRMTRGY